MLKLVDYHVHSNHSCDGKSPILEMCQEAIGRGIVELGFSEHMDFDPQDLGYGFFDYDLYTSEIRRAQETFGNRLVIRKGIEIDYQYCFEDRIRDWLKNKNFDFAIGSIHYIDHEFINRRLLAKKDLGEIYDIYFDEVSRSIESGLFDIIGHLDLIRKHTDKRALELNNLDYEERMRTILTEIIGNENYLEINTKLSVLERTCTETMPSREIVEDFVENGGRLISVGSDAHSKDEIGIGVEEQLSFLAKYEKCDLHLLFGQNQKN